MKQLRVKKPSPRRPHEAIDPAPVRVKIRASTSTAYLDAVLAE